MSSLALTKPTPYYSFGLGVSNISYNEAESNLKDESGNNAKKTPISGSAMVITLMGDYTIPFKTNQAVSVRGVIPLLASTGRIFSLGAAYQYYFGNKAASDIEIKSSDGVYIKFSPKFRYYAGAATDVSYLFYTSETAKKTDLIFHVGPTGGMLYRWKDNIDIKLEADFQIGFGSVVSTTNIKVQSGLTYQF
ncbi:hypothetical protein ACRXCV_14390 [Halobacteriovorax sp. GFR7]|uniref:hypothetical protein n=1 Tax=unclassified Halobacteriovorax TaxID=2639665 RepID=UPI003D965784